MNESTEDSFPIPGKVVYAPVEDYLIRSTHIPQTYRIRVMSPGMRRDERDLYPVVYITDANWSWDMLKGISRLIDRFVLVGIGYPSDVPHAGSLLRIRDLTASPYPQWGDSWIEWYKGKYESMQADGVLHPAVGTRTTHGAEDFQKFLAEELFPFIEDRHPVDPDRRIYFGHSAGGFFGIHTLFKRPELFCSYIASSPGVIYHGEAPGGVHHENNEFGLEMIREVVAGSKDLSGKHLYVSAGTEEEFERDLVPWRLTSSLYRFVAALRSAHVPGLKVDFEILPGEDHHTVWAVAFTHGVQAALGLRRIRSSVYDR